MKEKLQRFMYGRYGLDSFGKFTIIVSLVLMLLANFVPARLGSVLSLLCWALVPACTGMMRSTCQAIHCTNTES